MFDGIAEHEGRETELANAIFFFLRNCLFFLLFLFNLFLFNDLIAPREVVHLKLSQDTLNPQELTNQNSSLVCKFSGFIPFKIAKLLV